MVEVKEDNTTLNFSVSGKELVDFIEHLLDTGIKLCEIEDLVNYLHSRGLLSDILDYIEL